MKEEGRRIRTKEGRGLPEGYRLCLCGMGTKGPVCRCGRSVTEGETDTPTEPCKPNVERTAARREPTKTEAAYARTYLTGKAARYEALTFLLANGHRYTPDWSWWQGGHLWAVEVKGSYRLGSYQRARLAFDQVRIDFPDVHWLWAERRKDGTWKEVKYAVQNTTK